MEKLLKLMMISWKFIHLHMYYVHMLANQKKKWAGKESYFYREVWRFSLTRSASQSEVG